MFLESRADDANTTILPSPAFVLTPSGNWDGNDGKWSSFVINVGDVDGTGRGQNFRVLISTSSPITQVPLQSRWCGDAECAKTRGVEVFNSKQPLGLQMDSSTGWNENGLYGIPFPPYWSGGNLNGTWGWANVGLGPSSAQSKVLEKQMVVGNTNEELYMGSFGLAGNPVDVGGGPQATFLENIAQFNQTPSISYGYTAGAYYRNNNKGTLASLILGGYDKSRFVGGTSIEFPSPGNTTLVVGIQSITYRTDKDDAYTASFTANRDGFLATIDSTLPYLWLPKDICDKFRDNFGLTYDKDTNMYTVNDTMHSQNTNRNATVTFKIGAGASSSNEASGIALPYAAFDLEGSQPPFTKSTKYFPIRQSPNGVYVLGRTFLQEAYLIVDYERNNFTVAPTVFSDPLPSSEVISIFSTSYVPPQQTETPPSGGGGGGGLSGGAIAGIVVGIVVVLGIFAIAGFLFWKKRREQQRKLNEKLNSDPQEIDTTQAGDQVKHRRVSELDSQPPTSPKPSMTGYYDAKDTTPFPPINEMESPPAELYSPPPESIAGVSAGTPSERGGGDYFLAGAKMRRRGATRESSGNNTPGTPAVAPIAELPGDDGKFTVDGQHFEPVQSPTVSPTLSPAHSRGPSNTSLPTNIDQVISTPLPAETAETEEEPQSAVDGQQQQSERRPSHARGASDITVQSESTAVSEPTREELEHWATAQKEPRRPLSE